MIMSWRIWWRNHIRCRRVFFILLMLSLLLFEMTWLSMMGLTSPAAVARARLHNYDYDSINNLGVDHEGEGVYTVDHSNNDSDGEAVIPQPPTEESLMMNRIEMFEAAKRRKQQQQEEDRKRINAMQMREDDIEKKEDEAFKVMAADLAAIHAGSGDLHRGDRCEPKTVEAMWDEPVDLNDDIHLFSIWHDAYKVRQDIIEDMQTHFDVLSVFKMGYPASSFLENLWRIYSAKGGVARDGMEKKVMQCGVGEFTIVIVRIKNPRYRILPTAHGDDCVSALMHRKKALYREMSGGGFRVHGTFNPLEADHDMTLVLGLDRRRFMHWHNDTQQPIPWSGEAILWKKQTFGIHGWKSCKDFELALRVTTRFAMRFDDDDDGKFINCTDALRRGGGSLSVFVLNHAQAIATSYGTPVEIGRKYRVVIRGIDLIVSFKLRRQLSNLIGSNTLTSQPTKQLSDDISVIDEKKNTVQIDREKILLTPEHHATRPSRPDTSTVKDSALVLHTVVVAPLDSPFIVSIRTKDGSPINANVRVKFSGKLSDREILLHRGRGSTSIVLDSHLYTDGDTLNMNAETIAIFGQVHDNAILRASLEVKILSKRLASREVQGVEYHHVTWGPDEDIFITHDATFQSTSRVRIAHGTRIFLSAGILLTFKGDVQLSGSLDNPILVTSANSGSSFGEIAILNGATVVCMHTWITGGGYRTDSDALSIFGHSKSRPVIRVKDSHFTLYSGGIVDNVGKAIGSENSRVYVIESLISRCDTGGEHKNSLLHYRHSHVLEIPDADGFAKDDDNDGIYIRGTHSSGDASLIQDCVFSLGEDDGIDQNGAKLIVERTWIQRFLHEGIAFSNSGPATVRHVVVEECDQGIEVGYGRPNVTVERSLVQNNNVGFRFGDSYDWGYSGHLVVRSSVAKNNKKLNAWNGIRLKEQSGFHVMDGAINITCSLIDDPCTPISLKQNMKCATFGPNMTTSFPATRRWNFFFDCSELTQKYILGKGAYKTIYKGKWGESNVVFGEVSTIQDDAAFATKLIEVERRGMLRHVSIAAILGACVQPKTRRLVIVTEYRPGSVLASNAGTTPDFLPNIVLNSRIYMRAAVAVAEGLAYLHYGSPLGRVIHHDFKPANVLVSEDGDAAIIDFDTAMVKPRGVSKIIVAAGTHGCGRLSCPGVTQWWMAPECVSCNNWDERFEVFNLGQMLVLLTSGEFPHYKDIWSADDYYSKLGQGYNMPTVPAAVPKVISDIIAKTLVFNSEKRLTSDKVARSLRLLLDNTKLILDH